MRGAKERSALAQARVGSVLAGKWTIERVIGLGGMAAVFEARHHNQRRVAVKLLEPGTGVERTRLQREGYAANRVGHPGVVEIYDDDIDEDGSAFLVMELLHGQSVADLARAHGGRLPPEDALKIADRLLEVLEAAHAKSILHRDIKPENLFQTTSGELKVLDFGIARLVDREGAWSGTLEGTVLGTPAFSPPEQARGRMREIDERSDLWAVGATLFKLLTGRCVHEADTPNEQLGMAMALPAPPLRDVAPELPAALAHVVDRALSYERDDRWPSASAMRAAIGWVRAEWQALLANPSRMPAEWCSATGGTQTVHEVAKRSPLSVSRRRTLVGAAVFLPAFALVLGMSQGKPSAARDGADTADRPVRSIAASPPGKASPQSTTTPRVFMSETSSREVTPESAPRPSVSTRSLRGQRAAVPRTATVNSHDPLPVAPVEGEGACGSCVTPEQTVYDRRH